MTRTFPRNFVALCAAAAALLLVLAAGSARADAAVLAGAAKVDASWHVGASAGQYAGDCATDPAEDLQGIPEDGQEAFEVQDPTIFTDGAQEHGEAAFAKPLHHRPRKRSNEVRQEPDRIVAALVERKPGGRPLAIRPLRATQGMTRAQIGWRRPWVGRCRSSADRASRPLRECS